MNLFPRFSTINFHTYLQEILNQVHEDSPTIILSEISARDVQFIVDFIYNGEVSVPVENIGSLLEAAHSLKIRGLMEVKRKEDKLIIVENTFCH